MEIGQSRGCCLTRRMKGRIVVVNDARRRMLYDRLTDAMGSEAADALMDHLPPTGWSELATQAELLRVEAALRSDFDRFESSVGGEFKRVESALRADIERGESALRADIERGESALRADIARVDAA